MLAVAIATPPKEPEFVLILLFHSQSLIRAVWAEYGVDHTISYTKQDPALMRKVKKEASVVTAAGTNVCAEYFLATAVPGYPEVPFFGQAIRGRVACYLLSQEGTQTPPSDTR